MKYQEIKDNLPLKKYVSFTFYSALEKLKGSGLMTDNLAKQYGKVNDCVSWVSVATCKDCGDKYFEDTYYCNSKLCPVCSRRRSLKYLSLLVPRLNLLLMRRRYINFLTLTIKDTDSLKKGIDTLESAWRYMTHQDAFSAGIFQRIFSGGIRSMEIKKGKNSHIWHPHLHLIIVKDDFSKDFDIVKGLWEMAVQKVTKTTGKVASVYINSIKDKNNKKTTLFNSTDKIISAVCECVKYLTKFNFDDYSPQDLLTLCNEIVGKRTINCFGCLYGLNKQLELKTQESEEDLKQLVCTNCGCLEFDLDNLLTEKLNFEIKDFPTMKEKRMNKKHERKRV